MQKKINHFYLLTHSESSILPPQYQHSLPIPMIHISQKKKPSEIPLKFHLALMVLCC